MPLWVNLAEEETRGPQKVEKMKRGISHCTKEKKMCGFVLKNNSLPSKNPSSVTKPSIMWSGRIVAVVLMCFCNCGFFFLICARFCGVKQKVVGCEDWVVW